MTYFQRLIKDLNAAGWTQDDIAAEVGCSQTNISTLLTKGTEPLYGLGRAIIELHERECDD
jgi:transcriptional regulator with XRE-family HTH domain